MVAGFVAAWLAARYVPGADLPSSDWVWVILGVLIMLAGFTLRVGSIVVLGRFFRRDVTIEAAQTVIRRGPYRYIRHPAYAGNLLVALGFGLALANWLSIAALVALPFLGLLPRIRVEEAALESALGEPYRAYEADTARLVPGLW
jgi:protein-S-isoprenylcysteine O-methyltransferase Ste14